MKILSVLICILLLSSSALGFVKDPAYDDLEDYELVAALIKDGKLALAAEELKKSHIRKDDPSRFQLLNGQYYYAKGEFKKALAELAKVGPGSASVESAKLFQARAWAQLKDYKKCAEAFKKVALFEVGIESDSVVRADCEYRVGGFAESVASLRAAGERYNSFTIARESIGLKIKMGLIHEALLETLDWFAKTPAFPSQYLDLAEAFHQKGSVDGALSVLETGRSQYPMHLDINLTLSQLYFQKNLLMATEDGFSRAAGSDAKYFYHTAEVNRQLGRFERAQYFNGFVVDPKEKIKQKIAGYVDAGKFPMIASLESVLSRSELGQDDEIKYALAYSLVKMGQIEQPLKYLSSITKPELVEKTTVLRKTLIDCQTANATCSL